ncbi:MAG: hypothetical protein WDN45_11150 [Caulobacteraceae bacterium]
MNEDMAPASGAPRRASGSGADFKRLADAIAAISEANGAEEIVEDRAPLRPRPVGRPGHRRDLQRRRLLPLSGGGLREPAVGRPEVPRGVLHLRLGDDP